uniref:OBERON-like protein n=1 Tax=Anthurium amnicola TaxID=1678845 RepID=A0A1D1YV98_9ARAE
MGTSSGANLPQQPPPKVQPPPPQQHLRPVGQQPLALVPFEAAGHYTDVQEPASNSDHANASPSESESSRETWPVDANRSNAVVVKKAEKEKEGENECPQQQVIRRISTVDKLSLRDVVRERVETISERMMVMPDELLEELKSELRVILEGTGGSQHREEFLNLQKVVQGRSDLTDKALTMAHRAQLEILVAINTGIQAFLHPNVTLPPSRLIEVFIYKRCRNIACQSSIPADDCACEICTKRNGFCNLCMCVICNKFDFEVNTCRWIGCDLCSHWTHTDCAIHVGLIGMGHSAKSIIGPKEMLFRCQACNRTSELLGWVKDVFQHCAPGWDWEAMARELDFVSRIFRGSEDPKGKKLLWKCKDLIEKMKTGVTESTACKMMSQFFQELEVDSAKNSDAEDAGRIISPQEACNRIADVVQEAVRKMEMVAEEKMRMFKRARLALEACDRELEDKAREVQELKMERQRKKQQVEELESIVRLKQAEAEMFQFKANEARREAERLQSIALAKSEKAEQEYASRYLKARLDEAEMEKQLLFEKMKLQEGQPGPQVSSGGSGDPSQTLMLCKIQDFLKNVYNAPPKQEG